MDKRDKFENKINEKLELVPVTDADAAWGNFMPMLDTPSLPFYRHWLAPYLFALSLFLISLGWQEWKTQPTPEFGQPTSPMISTIDTLVRRDTVYLLDTVYILKKVVINEQRNLDNTTAQQVNTELLKNEGNEEALLAEEVPQVIVPENNSSNQLSQETQKETPSAQQLTLAESSQTSAEASENQPSDNTDLAQQHQPKDAVRKGRTMSAPSIAPQPERKFVLEKEFVEGDTSNLNNPPTSQKSKPFVHIEAISSLLFPISKWVDYSITNQSGIQIGLEWESGWGIYTGAIYNKVDGELDDEEIRELGPSVIGGLPDSPADIGSLDEIKLSNQQWYFPLELRWRSKYYNGFSFESSFGLMGNYLVKQEFGYEFENESISEYSRTTTKSEFSLSHLRMGIGSNYLLSKRWAVFLRSHYWMPLTKTGLLDDRMHGLEVGAGANFLIGK